MTLALRLVPLNAWLFCFNNVFAAEVDIAPVQKVLDMLEQMKAKGTVALEDEAKVYATYAEWVDDQVKDLGFEIETEENQIAELKAFAEDADAKVAKLKREIEELDANTADYQSDLKAATELRESQNTEFDATQQDYSESVDALENAIAVMKKQDVSRPEAEALIQRLASTTRASVARQAIKNALDSSESELGAPSVAAYEFQSGGIVEVLEGLLDKFKGQLSDVESEESERAHNYNLLKKRLEDLVAKATSDRNAKQETKAQTAAASAKAKGDQARTEAALADDEKLRAEIKATFASKTTAFKQNQKVRKDELEAIVKAMEIIASGTVKGSYEGHIKSFVQQRPVGISLLQMNRGSNRAMQYLNERAHAISSADLATIVKQMSGNPFDKVVKMIEDLLEKLREEAQSEADHKEWCDKELHDNKNTRNKHTNQRNKLQAQIDESNALIAEQGNLISTLSKEQAALTKAMNEATKIRTAEKAENMKAIADAKAGLAAVKQALVILREFYAKQGSAFVQQKQVPEMGAYTGMKSGGIIGMLEVIESDFARLKADTETSEADAARAYKQLMSESEESKNDKHKEEVQTKLEKDQEEFENSNLVKDHGTEVKSLAEADKYYAELQTSCTQVHVSYEERKKKREEEIAALKEAYKILDAKQ